MSLLAEHARTLEASATTLRRSKQIRGAFPLRALAEEEAAKFLILLDVARCPRKPQRQKRDQLARFHDHLAKGIYARVSEMRPADYGEVGQYVEGLRQSHYLDGPNDVDWVFRNEVEAQREERLYVDFMESDEGRSWHSPAGWDDLDLLEWSDVIRLVAGMERAGFASPEGLQIVAELWRGFVLVDSVHWQTARKLNVRTLETLKEAGLADDMTEPDASVIVEQWSFPLHSLDLRPIQADIEELRERQRNWSPW
jgi:AbiV family abortive infection protein